MTHVLDLLRAFFTEAWTVLVGALLVFGLLGMLTQALRSAAALTIGARYGWANALGSGIGLLLVALFGLLGVPVLVRAASSVAGPETCAPLADLGVSAARLLAVIGSIRMLWSLVRSAAGLAVGAPERIGAVFIEAGETVIGMLLISAAGPIAAYFLGVC